jgi:spermidine synthase
MDSDDAAADARLPYYFIAFLSGCAVMAVEILSAKAVAPVLGASLYVWSSVIGVTLAGLTAGYFIGGIVADKFPRRRTLAWVLTGAAIGTAIIPKLAAVIMGATLEMDLKVAGLISCLTFLFPPLVMMGMVSPLLIRLATTQVGGVGRVSGGMYAVSTVGGILGTFVWGFVLIPYVGVKGSSLGAAGLLVLAAGICFALRGAGAGAPLLAVPILLVGVQAGARPPDRVESFAILYRSDGLYGRVHVVDRPGTTMQNGEALPVTQRLLVLDGVAQTRILREDGRSLWNYVHRIAFAAGSLPEGSRALVLGLGGGSIAGELIDLGFRVDGCDIDPRMGDVARRYFDLDPRCVLIVDDARRLLRTTKERYNLIVIDVFAGELDPDHLLSAEAFEEMKRVLVAPSFIAINWHGYLRGERGLGTRCVYRTLEAAGFAVRLVGTSEDAEHRNLIFLAFSDAEFARTARPMRANPCCTVLVGPVRPISPSEIDLSDAFVLVDDRPVLNVLNRAYHEKWRREALQSGWGELSLY